MEIRLKDIQLNQVRNTMCSPERITEFGSMKRDELKAAVEVNVRAHDSLPIWRTLSVPTVENSLSSSPTQRRTLPFTVSVASRCFIQRRLPTTER